VNSVEYKKKKIVCTNCPLGCKINVVYADADEIEIVEVKGNRCKRGLEFVKQEITDPLRVVVTSVKVEDGEIPMASVRSDKPVPLRLMQDIMKILKETKVKAPVKRGDVVIQNILNTGSDIIATRSVNRKK
jgi:CxxC motif-containing protein